MKPPKAWKILGEQLHPDFVLIYGDFKAGIEFVLGTFSAEERDQIEQYLIYLVDSNKSGEEKLNEWLSSGAELCPSISQMPQFLVELLRLVKS